MVCRSVHKTCILINMELVKKKKKYMFKANSIVNLEILSTVMILSFRTDMPGKTVETLIRLLLEEEQSDQGLHCLPFRLHRLDSLLYGRATQFKF